MHINNSNYSILELVQMIDRRELTVNTTYQRGSEIWPAGPSSYFIDTILEGFPFPRIYIYEYLDRAAASGAKEPKLRKDIVDGQQRISAIKRFHDNQFAISGDSKYSGLKFSDFDEDLQNAFLTYTVNVDVIRNAKISEILQMFRRMNAYTLPLNEAEKRHSSFQGAFKWFVNELANEFNEFFVEFGVLTNRQIIRMGDAALIADIVLAVESGIVSASPKDLNALYKKYDVTFDSEGDYRNMIRETFTYIVSNFGHLRKTFMMKPYALHSLATALIHARYGISEIEANYGIPALGEFAADPKQAAADLLAMAQAHEAKEIEGRFASYVWGTMSTTDRKLRRQARVASILRALGAQVPESMDANLT